MGKSAMSVKGISKILKTTRKIRKNLNETTGVSVERAALEIESEAVRTVQVDKGRLKESIQSIEQDSMNYEVSAGGVTIGGVEISYAAPIEFGTRNSRAYPFMRPAAAKIENKYADIITDGVEDGIRKAGVK